MNGESWYEAKAAYNKSRYRMFQIIVIVASVIITVNNFNKWIPIN
jgi:hypothetical protein